MKFRHEWKHAINMADLLAIRQRLSAICSLDTHASNGSYKVRSLYFDNAVDKALREKIDGVDRREKFRIRYFDDDTSFIRLEKKSKRNGLGCKEMVPLTADETQRIVDGDLDWMVDCDRPLVRELYCKMRIQGLRPKTIVDYIREPFIFPAGDVRVTLDSRLRTGICCTDLLNPDCITVPVPGDPIVLEVKWNEFLPSIIRDAVQEKGRRTAAFSKYAACRLYG